MKIIIAGCGIVGTALAVRLSDEKHDVTIIDVDGKKLEYVQNSYDVMAICGNATHPDVLIDAKTGSADIFIAATDYAKENLVICMLARKLGAKRTIARVRDDENAKIAAVLKEEMGLSMLINPEKDAAREIFNSLKYKPVGQVESLAKGSIDIITCLIKENMPVCGVSLKELKSVTNARVLVCAVKRNEEVFIPDADTVLEAGDILSFAGSTGNVITFLRKNKYDMERITSVAIVGGSKLCIFLARMVIDAGLSVKIIDGDEERCKTLMNLLPEAEVICGDGTDTDLLEEENVLDCSAVVAATGDDATNAMISMYVSRQAPDCKVIMKIKKSDFEDMLFNLNIGSIYNPKYIIVENIARYVQAVQDSIEDEVESSCRVIDNKVCIFEFNIHENMPHLSEPLRQMKLKKGLIVVNIYRKGKSIIPGADDTFEVGDRVIVATTDNEIHRFAEIFD